MPLALTCPCGTRFTAEDALAGREVLCPDCQQPVRAPAAPAAPRRTSLLALASAVLALVGAFTLVGTAAAVLLGLLALVGIARNRERVAGAGLAAFGVVAGGLLTAATLFALTSADLFGMAGWLPNMGGEGVDTGGPLEVVLAEKGFAITRPTARWGRFAQGLRTNDVVGELQTDADLILVQAARHLYVDVTNEDGANGQGLDHWQAEALAALNGGAGGPGRVAGLGLGPRATLRHTTPLPTERGVERRELELDVRCGVEHWTMLLRLHQTADGDVFVTRAYARQNRFRQYEAELRKALDSFRVLGEGR
jgi:hypothetical protein